MSKISAAANELDTPAASSTFPAAGPNNFDALRLLLAALVVVSHAFPLGEGSEAREPLARSLAGELFGRPTTLGALAVDGFFIISGFLIAMSWERRRSAIDFFARRVRRIYPGFIVAALIGAYVVPLVASDGPPAHVAPVAFAANVVRLIAVENPAAFATNVYPHATNGSLWSIAYEFWCYVGVALLGATGLLARRRAVTLIFLASLAVAVAFSALDWRPGGSMLGAVVGYPVYWARLLPFYLAGVVAYRWRDRLRFGDRAAVIVLLATVATAFVPHAWAAVLPVTLGYLLFWVAYSPRLPRPDVTRFGDWSYGMYLYAFPIQQLAVRFAGGSMSPWALMAVTLPLSALAGAASWCLVERLVVRRPAKRTLAVVHAPDPVAAAA